MLRASRPSQANATYANRTSECELREQSANKAITFGSARVCVLDSHSQDGVRSAALLVHCSGAHVPMRCVVWCVCFLVRVYLCTLSLLNQLHDLLSAVHANFGQPADEHAFLLTIKMIFKQTSTMGNNDGTVDKP